MPTPPTRDLAAYVEQTLEALKPCAGAVVASVAGNVVLERYYSGPAAPLGFASDAQSLWYVYSVSKSFAAGLLLNYVTDGILGLDDPLVAYLPDFARGCDARGRVTIRHLASHTSGVAIADSTKALSGPSAISPPDVRLVKEPGEAFHYTQVGMILLELAIEAAGGEDFGTAMESRVLAPLSLDNTRYLTDLETSLPLVPTQVGSVENPALSMRPSPIPGRAGTGLWTTARDLNRYGRLWLGQGTLDGHRIFSPELLPEAWKPHGTRSEDGGTYGLLWWLFPAEGGYTMSGAAHSVNAVVPENEAVVTVLRNRRGSYPGPFTYIDDRRRLVRFGRELSGNAL